MSIFQLDFPFLLWSISQNWNSAFTIAFFWVGFPVSAVKYFSKLGFSIYHSFFCDYYAREYSADVYRISCLCLKELIQDKEEGGGRRERISRDVLWGKLFIGVTPPNREAECLVRKGAGLWTIFEQSGSNRQLWVWFDTLQPKSISTKPKLFLLHWRISKQFVLNICIPQAQAQCVELARLVLTLMLFIWIFGRLHIHQILWTETTVDRPEWSKPYFREYFKVEIFRFGKRTRGQKTPIRDLNFDPLVMLKHVCLSC